MQSIKTPTQTEATWAARVREAQRGDRTAFDGLARHYRPLLFTIAFLRSADTQEAEDLVQETLAQAWTRLPALKSPEAFPAWIRAIIVHACNTWFRKGQRRVAIHPLEEALSLVADGTTTPLACILRREQQRELYRALFTLPEANRIAILLHVWGGYAYAEIAALTGVLPSTIEGRIYRAKRQLRNQLNDEGAGFLQEPRRTRNHNAIGVNEPHKKENPMTVTLSPATQPPPSDLPLNCVLFTERFSRLIDGGVSLVRSLQALEDIPPPYGPAIADLRRRVEGGDSLSGPMKEYPQLFSAFYVGMVRAGEAGGVLEETLQRARQVTTREWELARRRPTSETPLYLTLPSDSPPPGGWTDLTKYQRLLALALFCNALSILLSSGVPILQALEIVGELLPTTQRMEMETVRTAVREAIPLHKALEPLGIFPSFVIAFLEAGFVSGSPDSALYLAAETIEQEMNCRFGGNTSA